MDFDFEDTGDPLHYLRKIGEAFPNSKDFLKELEGYGTAGWPFGRRKKAFLLWAQFGQGTTVN